MPEIRRLEPDELERALAFERNYVGTETTLDAFRDRYRDTPELFVGYFEDDELIGEASGRYRRDDDVVELTAIGTKNGREHEGIATGVLEAFEANAAAYADRVSVASADNVEGFYRACGYEPAEILLQVPEDTLPADYDERVPLAGERAPSDDWRFLYAAIDEYSETLRDDYADRVNAAEVNTIYQKPLDDVGDPVDAEGEQLDEAT